MAMEKWKAAELRNLGESLMTAGRKLISVSDRMVEDKLDDLILQARTAMTVYGPSIVQLASLIEAEFLDQRDAIKFNRVPRWLLNQKKIEARKEKMAKMKADRQVEKTQPPKKDRKPD